MLFLDGALNEPHLMLQVEVHLPEIKQLVPKMMVSKFGISFSRGLFSGATAISLFQGWVFS